MPESNTDHNPPETGTASQPMSWEEFVVSSRDRLIFGSNSNTWAPAAASLPSLADVMQPRPRRVTAISTSIGPLEYAETACSTCPEVDGLIVEGNVNENLCRYCIADGVILCEHCEEATWRENALPVDGHNDFVCADCDESHYAYCDDCNTRYRTAGDGCRCETEESVWIQDHYYPGCGCCCQTCCSRRTVTAPRAINNYSYMPQLRFRGEGKVFLGAEIELVTSRPIDDARRAVALLGGDLVYCKEDGSISQGFELCTHPMSYEWMMTEFPWDKWEEFVGVRMGADSSTGIHVHVSRTAFEAPSHDYRWLLFWHRNAEFIQRIARRRASSYANFNGGERQLAASVAKKDRVIVCGKCSACRFNKANRRTQGEYGAMWCEVQLQKYAAVNLLHRDTYECRVFASTTDQTQIKAAFGLVAGTVEYTRKLRANDVLRNSAWDWQMFVDWAADQGDKYAPLISEVNRLSPRVVEAKQKPRKSATRKYVSPEAVF